MILVYHGILLCLFSGFSICVLLLSGMIRHPLCLESRVVLGMMECILASFLIYINELILKLEESGLKCRLHGIFVGYIFYADDILLVSDSLI